MLLLLPIISLSQINNPYNIKAQIIDSEGEPIEYMNVLVHSALDSSLIVGDLFCSSEILIENIRQEEVFLEFISAAYKTKWIHIKNSERKSLVDIGEVKIEINILQEVDVVSYVPLFQQEGDKTIMNVRNTVLSSSGSAADILKKSAKVLIDKDNNISVFGKGNAKIIIDGRETTSSELNEINSENISNIEIIHNPSAKYDADTKAVIKVNTIDGIQDGMYFTTSTLVNKSTYFSLTESLRLKIKQDKVEGYFHYIANPKKTECNNIYDREYSNNITMHNEITKIREYKLPSIYYTGVKYLINDKSRISLLYKGTINNGSENTTNINNVYDATDNSNYQYETLTKTDIQNNRNLISTNYTFELDSTGQLFELRFNYSDYINTKEDIINEEFLGSTNFKKNESSDKIDIITSSVDYSRNIKAIQTHMDIGAKYSTMKTKGDNTLYTKVADSYVFSDQFSVSTPANAY